MFNLSSLAVLPLLSTLPWWDMTSGLHLVCFLCGYHKLLNPWHCHWEFFCVWYINLLALGCFKVSLLLHSACSWSRMVRISPERTSSSRCICRSEACNHSAGWEAREERFGCFDWLVFRIFFCYWFAEEMERMVMRWGRGVDLSRKHLSVMGTARKLRNLLERAFPINSFYNWSQTMFSLPRGLRPKKTKWSLTSWHPSGTDGNDGEKAVFQACASCCQAVCCFLFNCF